MEEDFSPKDFNRKKKDYFCDVGILGRAEGKVEKNKLFHSTEEI
jgi:hypothetical protein